MRQKREVKEEEREECNLHQRCLKSTATQKWMRSTDAITKTFRRLEENHDHPEAPEESSVSI